MLRLDRYLCELGIGSRKEIKAFIKQGLVRIEGMEAITNDMRIDEKTAVVFFGDERLVYKKFVYVMMNKPAGVISATFDKGGEKTVIDLLPEDYAYFGLFPVGRLDKDTVGLLILTNDGAFAHRLTSPKKDIKKLYYAVVTGTISDADRKSFETGIALDDFVTLPAALTALDSAESKFKKLCRKGSAGIIKTSETTYSEVLVEISEGKFHQIKRMFEALDKKVLYLKRVKHGKYTLPSDLEEGEIRELE